MPHLSHLFPRAVCGTMWQCMYGEDAVFWRNFYSTDSDLLRFDEVQPPTLDDMPYEDFGLASAAA